MRCRFFPLSSYEEPPEKAHGRIEFRKIDVLPAEALSAKIREEWQEIQQVARITRTRIEKKKGVWQEEKIEIAYLITSLTKENASPCKLLKYNKKHWGIENLLHRNKDDTLREDRCTCRLGESPKNMSVLLSLTLKIFHHAKLQPKIAIETFQDNKNKDISMFL